MARIATLWSDESARYSAPEGHPERAHRNQALARALATLGARVEHLPVTPAALESVLAMPAGLGPARSPRHQDEPARSAP